MGFDESILLGVNAWARSATGATLAVAFSSRWMILVVLGPLAIFWTRKKEWLPILSVALALSASDLIAVRALKPVFDRPRPCHTMNEPLVTPAGCGVGASMPSAHAANAFSVAAAAALWMPRLLFGLLPVAIVVSGSRVVLGVHYPSDVGIGAIVGTVIGLAVSFGFRRRFLMRGADR